MAPRPVRWRHLGLSSPPLVCAMLAGLAAREGLPAPALPFVAAAAPQPPSQPSTTTITTPATLPATASSPCHGRVYDIGV